MTVRGQTDERTAPALAQTLQMPAEWAEHDRCLMAWPVPESDQLTWWGQIEGARTEYAAVARAVAQFEPVLMVAPPGRTDEVRRFVGSAVDVIEAPLDDAWLRDSGPIFAYPRGQQDPVAVDFRFNAWGGRGPSELDDQVSRRLADHLGVHCERVDMILEGGAITVDGQGTLITTEQCLLNTNRNPTLSRQDIEQRLHDYLGIDAVIWLPVGASEMSVTDGHVDGVCAFVAPGRVAVQTTRDPRHPSYARLRQDLRALSVARDVTGRQLDIVEIPHLPLIDSPRGTVPVLPINFYLCNGGAIVPVAGTDDDEENLAAIAEALPSRSVVPVPGRTLALGGGGVHCITQQQPRPRSTAPSG
jgi:agmatine deiminase